MPGAHVRGGAAARGTDARRGGGRVHRVHRGVRAARRVQGVLGRCARGTPARRDPLSVAMRHLISQHLMCCYVTAGTFTRLGLCRLPYDKALVSRVLSISHNE
jgi:hypothetical protein